MRKTLLNTIIEEKVTKLPSAQLIKRHTRWIAVQSRTPIINGIFGTYINPHCHVHEAYDQNYLSNLIK